MKPALRNLKNYKSMHHNTARERGVLEQFFLAKTLTEAKKILAGIKKARRK